MNTAVQSFLLVSAAYLLGGSAAALADRDSREPAGRDTQAYSMEESAWEAPRGSTRQSIPSGPTESQGETRSAVVSDRVYR